MEIALLVIVAVLVLATLGMTAFVAFKRGHGMGDGALKDITKHAEEAAKQSEYTARMLENLSRATESRLAFMQKTLADDMKYIVDSNAQNLERIRRTVDDKLTSSIDGKLSESYARIAERLERMYESVGAMKSLSSNISDIHRVFTNVKLRGTWGEAQLDSLLSQMLAPEQYERSVKLNPLDGSLVDFAILLPAGRDETVYLPLVSCSEAGDRAGAETARKNLERTVKMQADSIRKKYILPPRTTDFALMYLPSEGLYAEVVKMDGMSDFLRSRRVLACGPTNLAALLSTLQTGFRTAAIEKRSGELRVMLEEFRADFAKFAEMLEKTRKKLQEAQDAVDAAEKRTGVIGRRLDTFRNCDPPADG